MSIQTKYICDKCGATLNMDELYVVKCSASPHHWPYAGKPEFGECKADWCKTCVAAAGFIQLDAAMPKVDRPTIDDFVRQIVSEMTGAV